MSTPFSTIFGELPKNFVPRDEEFTEVKDMFEGENPESKVFILSGPRGSGKTVLLTALSEEFEKEGYLVVDLNPFSDLEEQFAAKVYEKGKLKRLFLQSEFSFSFKGLGFSIKGKEEVSNVFSLIERMLEYLKRKGKKVLVTIDDVSPSPSVKKFVFSYQQMIRSRYSVYLLMSGLFENVSELVRDKSLTFLLRSPKLNLKPLDIREIAYSYLDTLPLSEDEAIKYAKLTKGYAYGYQLVGALLYKNGKDADILKEYDRALAKNSYSMIWENLSEKERKFLFALEESSSQKEMTEKLSMSNGNLQTYKERLVERGIVASPKRGKIDFALPRFKEFVHFQRRLEEE